MAALPPSNPSSRPKRGECQGYVVHPCDRDERDFHWSLEDVESSSDIKAKLNALDFSIPVDPEMPYFYPSIIILVSASSIDVELRWSATAWSEGKRIYLTKWVIDGEVNCEWTEDPKDNGGSNWNIKVTKNYRGRPTLASLGIVDPSSTDSVSAVSIHYALARDSHLNLDSRLQREAFTTAVNSRNEKIERLEKDFKSLEERFSALQKENQTLETLNGELKQEIINLLERISRIPLSVCGMV